MTYRFVRCLTPLLLECLRALAADQVVLTNGDTISGAIIKKDGDKLTIKSEFLGEVTMPWSAVKSIRSDADLNVVLPSGETVSGKIATSGDQLQIASGPQTTTAPLATVGAVRDATEQHAFERLQHPGILELWKSNLDVGLALARGNARSAILTTAFTASRETRNDKITGYFNQLYSTATVNHVNSTTANALRGGWTYNRNLTPRIFLEGFNDYEHDEFQDLTIRFVAGGGAGFKAVKSEHLQLDLDAGIDYQREDFRTGVIRNSVEAYFGDALHYQATKHTTITQATRFFTNLSDTGSYRINFDLGINTAVNKWLAWRIAVSDRFLSNPIPGNLRNDLLLSTGFHLSFPRM